jgi:sulfite reductase (ferredoxin)
MTGCPNGCARPYTAEIGIVGQSAELFSIYVGGSPLGTRLAGLLRHEVPFEEIATVLSLLFEEYAAGRTPGERFGDWAARQGTARLRELYSVRDMLLTAVHLNAASQQTVAQGAGHE